MNVTRRKLWATQLARHAAEDRELLRRATAERQAAEEALRSAKEREDLVALMATASGTALSKAEAWLSALDEPLAEGETGVADPVAEAVPCSQPRVSVAAVIQDFLRMQVEATYAEIKDEVGKMRPDVKAENCARDLNRMVKRGILTRPRTGSYRLAVKESEPVRS
ncbi:hypothetical protein ACFWXA_35045 [Streptomyces atroolivaceus]|uniref:Uncharacterized protein n=1 Tax=Streptomyces atroolivaceus TaxID=66869 RepID=A0ABV9VLK8_STRAZ|nr:hypothetical protein [Streptomyces atroolivaceus]